MGRYRRVHRLVFLISVLTLGIVAPLANVPVVAESDSDLDWLGSEARSHPPLGPPTDSPDFSRGVSTTLAPGPDRSNAHMSSDDELSDFLRIFPPDERVRISPTTHFPASAVALIEKRIGGTLISTCTGTFIGPNVVLTAGHCLFTHTTGWGTSIAVVPAKDGALEPFGYEWAYDAWVPAEWFAYQNPEWDWGLVRLPNSVLGTTVGWFQIGVLSTQSLMAPDFQPALAGYPGDKPYGTMWLSTVPSFLEVGPFFLTNRIDSTPGQSGSAVWRGSDGVIVGIQVISTEIANLASRIDLELLDDLLTGCAVMDCQFSYFIEAQPEPSPAAPPAPPPAIVEPVFAFGDVATSAAHAFDTTRARTDYPVAIGQINRTWMWGPHANSAPLEEPYIEAPGGLRVVQYFDKSRMEDNSFRATAPWHVTNWLLVIELITGRMQLGDNVYQQRAPAHVQVAGDDHPDSPTYAMLDPLRDWGPLPVGAAVTQRLLPDGSVADDTSLAHHGVIAQYYVSETEHTIASVFWEFMNSSGLIYEGDQFHQANLFENPFFATGFPITEAYWVNVPVAGVHQDVLLQCFQRRCLTYTPGNPPGWQVEAGNVGQHYYRWRYGDAPAFP